MNPSTNDPTSNISTTNAPSTNNPTSNSGTTHSPSTNSPTTDTSTADSATTNAPTSTDELTTESESTAGYHDYGYDDYDYDYDYDGEGGGDFPDVNTITLDAQLRIEIDQMIGGMDPKILVESGHQWENLVVSCTWKGVDCKAGYV